MDLPAQVLIREVAPRDGLQMEPKILATEDKISFVEKLAAAGVKAVEATSFVNPRAVPQLADAGAVIRGLNLPEDVTISALAANLKGLERAAAAGVREVNVVISASETHNLKNVNMTIAQSKKQLRKMGELAAQHDITLRTSLAMTFGCPYEGEIEARDIFSLVHFFAGEGIRDVALCDTAGLANPRQVYRLVEQMRYAFPEINFALHLHDTRGLGMVNVLAGLQAGITVIETSLGGLGGCPFIQGARGNVATEAVVYMLEQMDVQTGIDLEKLHSLRTWLLPKL